MQVRENLTCIFYSRPSENGRPATFAVRTRHFMEGTSEGRAILYVLEEKGFLELGSVKTLM